MSSCTEKASASSCKHTLLFNTSQRMNYGRRPCVIHRNAAYYYGRRPCKLCNTHNVLDDTKGSMFLVEATALRLSCLMQWCLCHPLGFLEFDLQPVRVFSVADHGRHKIIQTVYLPHSRSKRFPYLIHVSSNQIKQCKKKTVQTRFRKF